MIEMLANATGNESMCDILTKHCEIGYLITLVINIIKIATPVLLIVMGMIDFAKASTKANAEDITKARGIFFKRAIAGGLVFFVIAIVQFAVTLAANATAKLSDQSIWSCIENLINYKGDCGS